MIGDRWIVCRKHHSIYSNGVYPVILRRAGQCYQCLKCNLLLVVKLKNVGDIDVICEQCLEKHFDLCEDTKEQKVIVSPNDKFFNSGNREIHKNAHFGLSIGITPRCDMCEASHLSLIVTFTQPAWYFSICKKCSRLGFSILTTMTQYRDPPMYESEDDIY